jgi:hypothetical protein
MRRRPIHGPVASTTVRPEWACSNELHFVRDRGATELVDDQASDDFEWRSRRTDRVDTPFVATDVAPSS